MKLVYNWRTVLRKAWSMKFMAAATVFSGFEAAVALADPGWLPPGYMALLAAICTALGMFFRLRAQKEVSDAKQ